MLLPLLSMVTEVAEAETITRAEFIHNYGGSLKIQPGEKVPVILCKDPHHIDSLFWGINLKPKSRSTVPWVESEGIAKNPQTRVLIRKNRGLVLANCFYLEYKKTPFLIYFPGKKIISFAAIWKMHTDGYGNTRTTCALISRKAPFPLNKMTDRIPVPVLGSFIRKFLNTSLPLADIMNLFNTHHLPDFNGFPVGKKILKPGLICRKDLSPEGPPLFSTEKFPDKAILRSHYYLI